MRCVVVLSFLLLVSCATAGKSGTYSAKAYDHLLARRMVYYSASAYAPPSAVRFYSSPRGAAPHRLGLNAAATTRSCPGISRTLS